MSKMGGIITDETGGDSDKQNKMKIQYLEARLEESKKLQETALNALNEAIRKAENTQSWILKSNKFMFGFGIFLIISAMIVEIFTDESAYSVLFGGVGFLQIIASFFVGSMQRSQKAISDLIQVEIAFLNYFEQTTLWEQYASIKDSSGEIIIENFEKANDKINSCAKETTELLQKYIEVNETE